MSPLSDSAPVDSRTPMSSEELLKERIIKFESKVEAIEALKGELYSAI